jgi:hypothetical protein
MRYVVKERPHSACRFASRRFNFDHIRPQVTQEFATKLTLFIDEFENAQASKGA